MRYFLNIAYDGTAYHGWQVQPNAISVQQKINEALTRLCKSTTEVTGAGRTDTGVHASTMMAHFDTSELIDCQWLANRLNRILPPDISVKNIKPVCNDAHARFSATSRTYHYYVCTAKDPFKRQYAMRLHFSPDYEKMNKAAALLLNIEDFTSFSKLHTDTKNNICKVTKAHWTQVEEDLWRFEIKANRFLRNMVRAIVGTLLEIGRGRLSEEQFISIIQKKDRCAAGESVAGNALFLTDITYPEDIYISDCVAPRRE